MVKLQKRLTFDYIQLVVENVKLVKHSSNLLLAETITPPYIYFIVFSHYLRAIESRSLVPEIKYSHLFAVRDVTHVINTIRISNILWDFIGHKTRITFCCLKLVSWGLNRQYF